MSTKLVTVLIPVVLLVGVIAAYLILRRLEPPRVSFRDVSLDSGNGLLAKVHDDPSLQEVVEVPSGRPEAVSGFVGQVIVKTVVSGTPKYERIMNFRPSPTEITVTPEDEKIYEGVVTSNLALKGGIAGIAGELGVDEAADLLISNTMVAGYTDNSKIPFDRLRSIAIQPGHEYFFVDSVVLTTATYKKYHKIKADNTISGLAFSANGNIYASAESFGTRRYLCLRMFRLGLLNPAEGASKDDELQPYFRDGNVIPSKANEFVKKLREASKHDIPQVPAEQLLDPNWHSASVEVLDTGFVLGGVPALLQRKPNGCWATVAAMMVSWRYGKRLSADEFLSGYAPEWKSIYDADRGLPPQDKIRFLSALGLTFEAGQSYMPSAVEDLLRNYGPLWFTIGTDQGYSTHATLVVGMRHNASGDTFISYIDPATGRIYDEEYGAFHHRYENPAYLYNELYMDQMIHGSFIPLHVVHFASPNVIFKPASRATRHEASVLSILSLSKGA